MRLNAVLVACVFALQAATAATEDPSKFLSEISIGGEGGWDYLSIDPAARRLYVTHSTKIVVLDLDADAVVGEIADTPGVHGFAIAPELALGFSSNGKEAKVSVVDLKTLTTIAKIKTDENPDAILYEPARQEVYTFNGRGKSATVFEAKTGKVVATIPLPGKPEFAVADSKAGFVYCNIEDRNAVVVLTAQTHEIAATWPIAPGESASGMAIDLAHHRLFLGCENQLMLMMDSTNGKVISSVHFDKNVEANAFDPVTQLAFSSNGEGSVTMAHEDSPGKLTPVQELKTEPGARTMALDPQSHRIYLAAAKFEPMPSPAPGASSQRPAIVSSTLRILVYGPEK